MVHFQLQRVWLLLPGMSAFTESFGEDYPQTSSQEEASRCGRPAASAGCFFNGC
jgi:hypothetical protein